MASNDSFRIPWRPPTSASTCGPRPSSEAGDLTPSKIRHALRRQTFDAPGGVVRIDPETQHTSKVFRIGRITTESRFEVIYSSETPIAPIPYPNTRSQGDWDAFLAGSPSSAGAANGRTQENHELNIAKMASRGSSYSPTSVQ